MNEIISNWLCSDKNYEAGVALYEQYGVSATLKRILRIGGHTKKNLDTLIYELQKLNKNPHRVSIPIKQITRITTPVISQKEIEKPESSQILQKAENQQTGLRPNTSEIDDLNKYIKGLLKERDYLHANLKLEKTQANRKKNAGRIIELSNEIADIYDRLAHYDKHGILPGAPAVKEPKKKAIKPAKEMNIPELMRRQANLRTYVSKYERLVKMSKKPETIAKNQDLLKKYQVELDDVNDKLNK
jgi:hypothetical protein